MSDHHIVAPNCQPNPTPLRRGIFVRVSNPSTTATEVIVDHHRVGEKICDSPPISYTLWKIKDQ